MNNTPKKRILILDDEPDIHEILSYNLEQEGYVVSSFTNPFPAIEYLNHQPVSLILSDWLMPEMNGLQFCRYLKSNQLLKDIPVYFVTCKNEETDIISAFEAGAEDYIIKPFKINELLIRIRKTLRNSQPAPVPVVPKAVESVRSASRIEMNGLVIDREDFCVYVDGKPVVLTFSEFKLLELLVRKPGKVFSRSQIIENEYGIPDHVNHRAVDVKIVALRKKLGDLGNLIKTIRSVGYKFSLQ